MFGKDQRQPRHRLAAGGLCDEEIPGRIVTAARLSVGAGVSDIDNVLIGPAGVFTLNTKNHVGTDVRVVTNRELLR